MSDVSNVVQKEAIDHEVNMVVVLELERPTVRLVPTKAETITIPSHAEVTKAVGSSAGVFRALVMPRFDCCSSSEIFPSRSRDRR